MMHVPIQEVSKKINLNQVQTMVAYDCESLWFMTLYLYDLYSEEFWQ